MRALTGEDDELEEAANQAAAEEKTIVSISLTVGVNKIMHDKTQGWTETVSEFFQLKNMESLEEKMALRL